METMETFYSYSALIAGTLMLAQFLLSLVGIGDHDHPGDMGGADVDVHVDVEMGADGDVDHGFDHEHSGQWFVGMLSFRAIVAAVTVFGLTGLSAQSWFEPPNPAAVFLLALAGGGAVMYGVAWLMKMIYRLKSDGTVRIERAIGQTGLVYLTVPAGKSGAGKVTVKVQGRTMEYQALSSTEELPTGMPIVVVDVVAPGMLEVARATETTNNEVTHVKS